MAGIAYRREIDGLRAIAVLAVVLYHAGVPGLAGGFVGVDIFFVISGYLITSLLLREWRQHGRFDLMAFYARRVRRLLPALWLVIAATLVASMVLLQPMGSQMQGVLDSSIASLLFVANFHFAASSGGYFDGPAEEMPLLHLWSLSVEEQYYLVLPLALLLALRCRASWRHWLAGATIASFLLAEYWLRAAPSDAFYGMPARFWELGVGGLIAGLPPGRLDKRWASRLMFIGVLVTLAAVVTTQRGHFPGAGALPAVIGAGLVLWAVNDSERLGFAGRLLGSPPMVRVGLISYSLYLWHWPLLAFDRALAVEPSPLIGRLALCAVAVVLAWASYRWVEVPFRRSMVTASHARAIAFGAVASMALVAMAWGLRPTHSTTPLEELVWATSQDHPDNMARCHLEAEDEVVRLPGHSCWSDAAHRPDVVIWGDSHALAWQPFAWEIAKSQQQSAVGFTLDSCPPVVDFDIHRPDVPLHRERCRRFNDLVMDYLDNQRVQTLIVGGRWLVYFNAEGRNGDADSRPDREALRDGLDRALARVSSRVERIIVIAPPPQLRDSAPKCIGNQQLEQCAMPRAEYERMAARPRQMLMQLASRYPNVTIIDPAGFFCDTQECPVMRGGRALFWDGNHVATTAARAFAREYLREPERWVKTLR